MTDPETPPSIAEAWGKLHAWACDQRRDWDAAETLCAMRLAASRGASYRTVAEMLWRLAWDLTARTREVLGELSYLNRVNVPGGGYSPEALAALRAGDYERARRLEGTASVIPPVPVQGGAAGTETDHQEAGR